MAASVVAASVLASLNPGHIVNDGLNTTGNQTVQVTHCDEGGDGGGFLIGVGMGVVGSVLINIGQNLQATAMQSSPEVASKPCTSKTWITGLSVFVCGSLLNFLAFTFASASILVPIEAVQFVVNVIYGKYVNKKAISNRMLLGVTITIGGTVLCVTFGSSDTRCFTLGDMEAFWLQPLWWIYLLVSFSVAFFALSINRSYTRQLAIGGSPKHHVYVLPVTFAVSSALLGGGQMIVHSKAIAELFELQVQMIEPLPVTTWYFYLEFTLLATGGAFWLFKMNESLGMFDPLFIIPLLQSCYILFGVIAGGIYFEEFAGLHNGPAGWLAWPFFVLGMSGVLFGLYLIAPPVDADGGRKANGGADGVTMTISSSTHGALSGRNRVYSSEPHDETALEIYPSIDKPGPPIASYSSGVESSGSAGSKGHARKPSGNHAISGRHSRTPSQSAAQCAEISVQLEEADGMQGVLADSLDVAATPAATSPPPATRCSIDTAAAAVSKTASAAANTAAAAANTAAAAATALARSGSEKRKSLTAAKAAADEAEPLSPRDKLKSHEVVDDGR